MVSWSLEKADEKNVPNELFHRIANAPGELFVGNITVNSTPKKAVFVTAYSKFSLITFYCI
jgi:hypothetical protein